ncbi:MAG TPA: DUF1841 family protein [Burkholderiaceae bacterium]|nr:DUF1841 family protein [Burkholderiaceae bacterium]
MFTPNREQARGFFIQAWKKHNNKQPLSPLEAMAVDCIQLHPEYHAILEDPEQLYKDFRVEDGKINPFLHLSMHLAIAEQLSIDQPPGIKASYKLLCKRYSAHDAIHQIMECLGEVIWEAQRLGSPFSNEKYLELLQRRASR